MDNKKISKFLSLVLRHKPETIGLTLTAAGWALTEELIRLLNEHGHPLTMDQLKEIVATNDKKRFVFSQDFSRIRANQGHSIEIDLDLSPEKPPASLFHGTADSNIESIKELGLIKGERHHVHMSLQEQTALDVGMRYGKPVLLIINSAQMHDDGYQFYCSENNVWLTDHVPPQYITFK